MGEMRVPEEALYGAQTQRAVENFPISSLRFPRTMIRALGTIKRSAAVVNSRLGQLDEERAKFIIQAAEEVEDGALDSQFVLDIFQTGSGTSTNMNANEVICTRAKQLAARAGKADLKIHPNDHVNMSQSSNDVIPTAMHVSAAVEVANNLIPALKELEAALAKKSDQFQEIVKTGRTHLQDATPITLGQEFSGYRSQVAHGIQRIERALKSIHELPQGGTAVGTGLNSHPDFAAQIVAEIAQRSKQSFVEATNHFEAQGAKDGIVELTATLKTVATSLAKIANDVRWLGSGPRCGLGELLLPEVQPGSSIMPGKVNPVIAESLLMVCAQVIGSDAVNTFANVVGSSFELNVMMPVMAYNTLQAIELLSSGSRNFAQKCIAGIEPNVERIRELAEANISTCTALAPIIGYDQAAALAKEAYKTKRSIRAVALEKKLLPEAELDQALDQMQMTKPGMEGGSAGG